MCGCDAPIPSANPLRKHLCERCAKPLPSPPAPVTIVRDVYRERAWTMEACRGVTDPSHLIELSERRAASSLSSPYVSDPMTLRAGMDRPREAREEALDLRNHVVFWMQERGLSPEDEHDALIVLRHVAIAYDVLRRLDA